MPIITFLTNTFIIKLEIIRVSSGWDVLSFLPWKWFPDCPWVINASRLHTLYELRCYDLLMLVPRWRLPLNGTLQAWGQLLCLCIKWMFEVSSTNTVFDMLLRVESILDPTLIFFTLHYTFSPRRGLPQWYTGLLVRATWERRPNGFY